jgi:hypothetical protein
METLSIVSAALVVSFVAVLLKIQRSTRMDLGSVSESWILRHRTDQTGV